MSGLVHTDHGLERPHTAPPATDGILGDRLQAGLHSREVHLMEEAEELPPHGGIGLEREVPELLPQVLCRATCRDLAEIGLQQLELLPLDPDARMSPAIPERVARELDRNLSGIPDRLPLSLAEQMPALGG